MNKVEEYYKKKNLPDLDKFDKKVPKFDYYDMIEFAEDYHAEQLRITSVVGRSEQLEAAWKVLEWVGFTRGEEFDDDDVNGFLGL